ncbi:MAG TPA: hypothetical protein VND99_01520 [Candidatus Acidoferrales bacterium]|nr:hypothetical protein [Candidatus Acidoferrales bacterium]
MSLGKEKKVIGVSEIKGVGGLGHRMRVTRAHTHVEIRGLNGPIAVLFKGKPLLNKVEVPTKGTIEEAQVTVAPTLAMGKKGKEILQNRAQHATQGMFVRWKKVG